MIGFIGLIYSTSSVELLDFHDMGAKHSNVILFLFLILFSVKLIENIINQLKHIYYLNSLCIKNTKIIN